MITNLDGSKIKKKDDSYCRSVLYIITENVHLKQSNVTYLHQKNLPLEHLLSSGVSKLDSSHRWEAHFHEKGGNKIKLMVYPDGHANTTSQKQLVLCMWFMCQFRREPRKRLPYNFKRGERQTYLPSTFKHHLSAWTPAVFDQTLSGAGWSTERLAIFSGKVSNSGKSLQVVAPIPQSSLFPTSLWLPVFVPQQCPTTAEAPSMWPLNTLSRLKTTPKKGAFLDGFARIMLLWNRRKV